MSDFENGDTVKLSLVGKVIHVNSGGTYEIESIAGESVDYISPEFLTLVEKAPPAEPPLGTIIFYKYAYSGAGDNHEGTHYLRTKTGWREMHVTAVMHGPFKWSNFDHQRVYVLTEATAAVR